MLYRDNYESLRMFENVWNVWEMYRILNMLTYPNTYGEL